MAAISLEESSVFLRGLFATARPAYWWGLGTATLAVLLTT